MPTIIKQIGESGFQISAATLSHPHLYEPRAIHSKGQQPAPDARKSYSALLIFDPGTDINSLMTTMKAIAAAKFPKGLPSTFNWPIFKGEDKFPGQEEFQGKICINAKRAESQGAPKCVDGTHQPIIDPGVLYPGCKVIAFVQIYAYDNVSKGVNAGLEGIMFLTDGKRLDGRLSVDAMFAGVEGGTPDRGMSPPDAAIPASSTPNLSVVGGIDTSDPLGESGQAPNINPITGAPYSY